jgi:hypothetical protein
MTLFQLRRKRGSQCRRIRESFVGEGGEEDNYTYQLSFLGFANGIRVAKIIQEGFDVLIVLGGARDNIFNVLLVNFILDFRQVLIVIAKLSIKGVLAVLEVDGSPVLGETANTILNVIRCSIWSQILLRRRIIITMTTKGG